MNNEENLFQNARKTLVKVKEKLTYINIEKYF